MPLYIVGNTTTLSASGTGTLTIKSPLDARLVAIGFNTTGRASITNIDIVGAADLFDGEADIETLKNQDNMFVLPEPVPLAKNQDVVFSLEDLSGASNLVAITLILTY